MKKVLFTASISFLSGLAVVSAQTAQERQEIVKNYDQSQLSAMAKKAAEAAAADKQAAIRFAREKGIPLVIKHADGSQDELVRIDAGNVPIYYTIKNVAAARSTRANFLNTGGGLGLNCNGENMLVGVWDEGGVRATHQELSGRVTFGDNPGSSSNHGTHVAGTIAATGVQANAKGMANKASIKSFDWNSDLAEMTTAASQGLLLSNHSYGLRADQLPDWYFGAYVQESKDWDNLLFNTPYYVSVKAAGNDGTASYNSSPIGGSSNAYDKLSGAATAKNVLVVANAQDANINANGELTAALVITSSSSQGPTDDLRIKPDISGNGYEVVSPTATSNTSYGNYTGTSMASPNVTGTLTLIQQHFKNVTGNYMLGAALKGLALHTADDAGSVGPDVVFGWGLLNAKKMAETINNRNTTAMVADRTLNNGATDTVLVNSDGVSPLQVSISWYDRGGTVQTSTQLNSATKRLVNNLDLRVLRKSDGTVFNPWVLTSRSTNTRADNNSDNYERVDVGVVPAGEYAIAISHKGTLTGGNQNYTLVVTGKANGTVATCNAPTNLVATNVSASGATLSWAASSSANQGYTVEYKIATASTWSAAYTGTATTTTLSGLTANNNYNFRVRTNCSASSSSANADASFSTLPVAGTCEAPGNLQAANVTHNAATVSFSASSSVNTGYVVEYKEASASSWTTESTATTLSRNISNLSPATSYQWRVRTNCTSGSSSYASGSFTTIAVPGDNCATAYESNNTLGTAYTISLGTDYQAAIGTSGDVDYYKVTVPYGNYTVQLQNLTHDVDLAIQNASGQNLAISQNGSNSNEQIAATFNGGTYYFRVYPYSGYNANSCYTFRMISGLGNTAMAEGMANNLIDNASPVTVYPNPASNKVSVILHEKTAENAVIKVIDVLGREVSSTKAVSGENTIDVSKLNAGNYMINVVNGQGTIKHKFVKL